MTKTKVVNVRFSEQDIQKIKLAFEGENISDFVRKVLLAETEKRLSEKTLAEIDTKSQFVNWLNSNETVNTLYMQFLEKGNVSNG